MAIPVVATIETEGSMLSRPSEGAVASTSIDTAPVGTIDPPCLSTEGLPKNAKIMIVDDEIVNIKIVRRFLTLEGYEEFVTTTEPVHAMEIVARERPDVILLDIMMPGVDGLEILEKVRSDRKSAHTPVIILTASTDQATKHRALELGATDFLAKPLDPDELIPRVRNALCVKAHQDHLKNYAQDLEHEVRKRTAELEKSRLEVVCCLGRAAEYRDNETGRHVIRVGRYVGIIADELSIDDATVRLLELASTLHDVGKIGIPDSILLKPGKLDPEEFETMQAHSVLGKKIFEKISDDEWQLVRRHGQMGAQILEGDSSPLLVLAASIALTHHEKWDGSGYPLALAGESIPIEGRVTAVADVFDALSSKRPYKAAFPLEKCLDIMVQGRGTHFDPTVLDAFLRRTDDIVNVQMEFADIQ